MVGQPCDCVAPISIPVERLKTDRGEGPCNASFIALSANSRITARSVTGVDRSAFCSTGGSGKPAPKDPEALVAEPFGGSATKPTSHGRAHPLLAAAETAGSMLGSLAKALYPLPVLYRE
jgi:hypothetical protein